MLILFDLDGTLIDSEAGIVGSMEYAFARMGVDAPPRTQLRRWIGPPLRMTFPQVVGDDPQRVDEAVAHYHTRFDASGWSEHSIYPGMAEVVEALAARGDQLAVVTTKLATQARRIVAELPFGAHFTRVYGPGPGHQHSQKSRLIAQALRDFRASAAATVMIGDRHFDIEGARANAVRGIGVSWGFGDVDELRTAGADTIVDTPPALLAALQ